LWFHLSIKPHSLKKKIQIELSQFIGEMAIVDADSETTDPESAP
jgi:hypothetical protein